MGLSSEGNTFVNRLTWIYESCEKNNCESQNTVVNSVTFICEF